MSKFYLEYRHPDTIAAMVPVFHVCERIPSGYIVLARVCKPDLAMAVLDLVRQRREREIRKRWWQFWRKA